MLKQVQHDTLSIICVSHASIYTYGQSNCFLEQISILLTNVFRNYVFDEHFLGFHKKPSFVTSCWFPGLLAEAHRGSGILGCIREGEKATRAGP